MCENRMQALRKQHGYTQEQLAEKLGISPQVISGWETGQAIPDKDSLLALSRLFSVSLDDLQSGEEAAAPPLNKPDRRQTWARALVVLGLSLSCALWLSFQTAWGLWLGFALQITGCGLFESSKTKLLYRASFYQFSIWLLLPVPSAVLAYYLLRLYPSPYSQPIFFFAFTVLYMVFAVGGSMLIAKISRRK